MLLALDSLFVTQIPCYPAPLLWLSTLLSFPAPPGPLNQQHTAEQSIIMPVLVRELPKRQGKPQQG